MKKKEPKRKMVFHKCYLSEGVGGVLIAKTEPNDFYDIILCKTNTYIFIEYCPYCGVKL